MDKKNLSLLCVSTAIVIAGLSCSERSIPISYESQMETVARAGTGTDIVSSDWLYRNMNNHHYIVIDVRSADEFSNGHIPNSINIPFDVISVWAQSDFSPNGLWLELPELSDFIAQLGTYGISNKRKVVLVTSLPTATNPFSLAAPTRVALTLSYVGMKKIAILDGGFDMWANEGKPITTETSAITSVVYDYKNVADIFVDMDYVEKNLGKVILIDARDAEVYAGEIIETWALKPGHIPTAVSLPAPSLWNSDGTYKSKSEIRAIANEIIGNARNENIVIYCGVGGYASTVWFALTKILNYSNVKVFDGSAQEWVMTHDMEM